MQDMITEKRACMKHSISWEANGFSPSQNITVVLRRPNVRHRTDISPPKSEAQFNFHMPDFFLR
jgi:hypothetical protein